MNYLAALPFWAAAVALTVWAVVLLVRPKRAGREWAGDWTDGDARQRRCVGATKVTGPVVYYHFDADQQLVYIGKAKLFARRMRQEAHERMSEHFHTWFARSYVSYEQAGRVEVAEISRYQPPLNRQGVKR